MIWLSIVSETFTWSKYEAYSTRPISLTQVIGILALFREYTQLHFFVPVSVLVCLSCNHGWIHSHSGPPYVCVRQSINRLTNLLHASTPSCMLCHLYSWRDRSYYFALLGRKYTSSHGLCTTNHDTRHILGKNRFHAGVFSSKISIRHTRQGCPFSFQLGVRTLKELTVSCLCTTLFQ